jgi:pyridoxal phosphate enzyme (YggS family)
MDAENIKKIPARLEAVRQQITEAEQKSGRPEGSVKLLAVSKFHPVEAITAAYDAGQRLFGENRIQEAEAKFTDLCFHLRLRGQSLPALHIIGTVQRNKVQHCLPIAACIQSVDRLSLLEELEKQAAFKGKQIQVMFEYHTGEESKAGFTTLDDLLFAMEGALKMPHVVPTGFMTMAPFTEDESVIRKSFVTLREIAEKVRNRFRPLPLTELSMGMSNDFLTAIEEGSTLVRVGTAIFGPRPEA